MTAPLKLIGNTSYAILMLSTWCILAYECCVAHGYVYMLRLLLNYIHMILGRDL